EGTTREFDLTPYIRNQSIRFDYDIEPDPYGFYRTAIYLVTYGEIRQTDDAAAEALIAPTENPLQGRFNPTCGEPVVVIQNIGSKPLTTLEIDYGFPGKTIYHHAWNGYLAFLEKDTVVLPFPDWNEVTEKTGSFRFELKNPNGKVDPTPHNNSLTSTFQLPQTIGKRNYQFYFKTNHAPEETTWKIYDVATGNVLYENEPAMTRNHVYITELDLLPGSYKISLYDSGDDGLYFWAYDEYGGTKGAAALRYKISSTTYRDAYRFEPEFGRFAHYYFAIETFSKPATGLQTPDIKQLTVFPNPAGEVLFLDLTSLAGKKLRAEIYDTTGRKIANSAVNQLDINKISVASLAAGLYVVVLSDAGTTVARTKFWKK
ncbi:MAG: T9SS type A sorting domain-containing protein, partial [Dysgonamonadaceae bacterium]|nr:T9SS type A sorting domain-containing protein [Dysgonamonadaceae bacterium]